MDTEKSNALRAPFEPEFLSMLPRVSPALIAAGATGKVLSDVLVDCCGDVSVPIQKFYSIKKLVHL